MTKIRRTKHGKRLFPSTPLWSLDIGNPVIPNLPLPWREGIKGGGLKLE
jgi:hypothetical protein